MKKKNFQISTAIDYPSSRFHLGHAYEKICTDVMARWKELEGFNVHFSTGTDCHGLKIERAAKKAGKKPKDFVAEMSAGFRELCSVLNISHDDFIMTTERRHEKVATTILRQLERNGNIYKGTYEGLYCVDCESFYTKKDLVEGRCPVHKKPIETLREESYFFRMSKYQKRLISLIKNNPKLIWPEGKRKELLNRLKEPLRDLSISRLNVKWGIPLPFDKSMTVFVWVEALINYLTTINYPNKKFRDFWPATHVIGTDILWHHTAIWYSILLSLGLKLPNVVVHGFINLGGEKLSKARNITIDPIELAEKYSPDPLRYFLLREIPFGEDGDFSEEALVTRNNDELADILGNFVHRVLSFIYSKNKGIVPKLGKLDRLDRKIKLKIETSMERSRTLLEELQLHRALEEILGLAKAGNEYFQAKEPWKHDSSNCLYLGANLVRSLGIMLSPFIPESSGKMLKMLDVKPGDWESARELAVNPGHKIRKPEPLFRKLEVLESQEKKK